MLGIDDLLLFILNHRNKIKLDQQPEDRGLFVSIL